MQQFEISRNTSLPKTRQIATSVIMEIEKGALVKNDKLLSINEFSKQFGIARDTVEKAYNMLKEEGYITSVYGKGYFVVGQPDARIKILLIFNKLSSYKKIVYETFIETLGSNAKVDLHIHHYNPVLLRESLESSVESYHYILVMPHLFEHVEKADAIALLKIVPASKLMLLDKFIDDVPGLRMAVYQDFRQDIFDALISAAELFNKYQRVSVIFPKDRNHPKEIIDGIAQFCNQYHKPFDMISGPSQATLTKGVVYIVLTEWDLGDILKRIRKTELVLGTDIGVISFNETVFKELLDITVITTDFEAMGRTAAKMILNNEMSVIKNPFKMIFRKSL